MSAIDPTLDPAVKRFINAMPESAANSLSFEQLLAIQHALIRRGAARHKLDMRFTLKLPFVPFSFYLVLLGGRNRRNLTAKEQAIAALMLLLLITIGLTVIILTGLVFLYLLKSALGINVFEDYSLGLWDWFRSYFKALVMTVLSRSMQ